ncbi:hypothetical protein D5H78_15160 [Vallicoccus soli]|uniref:Uncharacterized protein n=2 Tax=Vallicoccus soli TaxID=2339232 RepID=A0A3A3YUE1_9ACTN|nr:hypothetical protein D5H78_15160 [Vallicoccus soli]
MVAVVAVVGLVPLAAPAQAAPPGNDAVERARVVREVPSRFVQSTGEATSSADDGDCVLGSSVWYRYTPTEAGRVRISTVGSSYDTVLAVFSGPRAERSLVACVDDSVDLWSVAEVDAQAGTTYWIAVSACCGPDAAGGRAVLSFYRPGLPPAPVVRVTSAATGEVSGRLFVRGTVACSPPFAVAVQLSVSQRVGRAVARGDAFVLTTCPGSGRARWAAELDSTTGWALRAGRASATVLGQTSDGYDYREAGPRSRVVEVTEREDARTVAGAGAGLAQAGATLAPRKELRR